MRKTAWRRVLGASAIVFLGTALVLESVGSSHGDGSDDVVAAAWEAVQDSGSYRFRSDVEQMTTPLATVSNAGRRGRSDHLLLEGEADLGSDRAAFTMWSGGGSVLDDASAVSYKIEDGVGSTRRGEGEWRPTSDAAQLVVPDGDPLTYLAAARGVSDLGPVRPGSSIHRHGFTVDGGAFAAELVQRMEAQMRQRRELPAGARLSTPSAFSDMTGDGEVWLDDAGRPVRMVVSLVFPPSDDEVVTATITTDFTDYGYAHPAGGRSIESRVADALTPLGTSDTVVLTFVVLLVALALVRRPAVPFRIIAIVVTAAMLGGPLAEPALAHTGSSPLDDMPNAVEQAQVDAAERRRVSQAVALHNAAALADPHFDRLGAMQSSGAVGGTATSGAAVAVDNGDDEDGDGLSDHVELQIGTNPDLADTDRDGVDDRAEVEGFRFGSPGEVDWYTDPTSADSNGDGLSDGHEWDAVGDDGIPDDIDGDGLPDLFDDDNDGDGVADRIDLAPFATDSTVWSDAQPLLLTVSGLEPGLPTFVDFQVRPGDPDHLRFALNEYDWPTDDKGQVRDVDGTPGDLELVPMLEIRIPDASHVLPDEADLEPYAITVNTTDDSTGERAAYLPLSLVVDDQTGERVAFSGRMRYLSAATWGDAHEIRVVWAVRVDNDLKCDPDDPDAVSAGCASDGYVHDRPEIVHRYVDDWTLTGLKVSEQHGAEIALLHEDPAVDNDIAENGPTWALSNVLAQRFLTATPQPGGGVDFDVTMDNIATLFDRTRNGGGANAPYGLPDILRVTRASFETFDEAVVDTAATIGPELLADRFTPEWDVGDPIRPLIITAYTTQSRAVTLDAQHDGSEYVSVGGSGVVVDLAPSDSPAAPLDEMAGVRWTPYCGGTASTPVWSACEPDEYWDQLEDQYGDQHLDPDNPAELASSQLDEDTARGQNVLMQLYALSMMSGVQTMRYRDEGAGNVAISVLEHDDDDELTETVESGLVNASAAAKAVGNVVWWNALEKTSIGYRELGKLGLLTRAKDALLAKMRFNMTGVLLGVFLLGAVTAFVVATIFALNGNPEAEIALRTTVSFVAASISLISPLYSLVLVRGMSALKDISTLALLGGPSELVGMVRGAAIAGTVVVIGITWGFFVYNVVSNDVAAFSPEFNQMLADTIASTIYTAILLALSLTVIGLIIIGIVAVVDAILTLICEVGSDRDKDRLEMEFLDNECFTISAAAVKVISEAVYSYDVMVDLESDDLVDAGTPDLGPSDPAKGYAVGNTLDVALPVTTNIVHKDPGPESWHIVPYLWFFSKDNLRSSSFVYSLTDSDSEDLSTDRDDMSGEWTDVEFDHEFLDKDFFRATKDDVVSVAGGIPFDEAGINRSFDVVLNMGYAVPAFECFTSPLIVAAPVCYKETLDGSTSDSFDSVYLDVFPATLGEFLELGPRSDGRYGFAWDPTFPAIEDLDGDGLLSNADGGLDPNDFEWDTDGDGLSDTFELEQRSLGVIIEPGIADTDGDGLTDPQELRVGTNPGVRDTDNDGLEDDDEVRHLEFASVNGGAAQWHTAGGWSIEVDGTTPVTLFLSSDPLNADVDRDGLSDEAERDLANHADPAMRVDDDGRPWHPKLANTSPLSLHLSHDDADGFVRAGQTLVLSAEATSSVAMEKSVLDVSLPTGLGSPPDPIGLPFDPDTFSGSQTVIEDVPLVIPDVASQPVEVGASVRGRLPGNGPSGLEMSVESGEAIPSTRQFGGVDLASRSATSPGAFTLAEIASSSSGSKGQGDVRAHQLVSGQQNIALDRDTDTTVSPNRTDTAYLRGEASPSIACTDDGRCMTVWEHYDNCNVVSTEYVKVIVPEPDANDGVEPGIYLRRDHHPDPLDDLEGFELLWFTQNNGGNDMKAGQQRGPNEKGFPVHRDYCARGAISMLEIDGSATTLKKGDFTPYYWIFDSQLALEFSEDTVLGSEYAFDHKLPSPFPDFKMSTRLRIPHKQHHTIGGAVLNSSGTTAKSQFDLATGNVSGIDHFRDKEPSIASDGDGYRVVWKRLRYDCIYYFNAGCDVDRVHLVGRDYTATGAPDGGEFTFSTSADERDQVKVVWAGDRYRTLVMSPRFGTISDVVGGQMAGGVSNTTIDSWDVAYDPVSDQLALVYERSGGDVRGVTYDGGGTAASTIRTLWTAGDRPRVAANPITGGWMTSVIATNGRLVVVERDSTLAGSGAGDVDITTAAVDDAALACPDPQAFPVTDLRFEEFPGATTFADSTSHGNDATASGVAPAAGVAGAPGASASDFAVRFDGDDDGLSLTDAPPVVASMLFWYRAAAGGGSFTLGDGNANGFGVEIDNATGEITWSAGGVSLSAATNVHDGAWHFIGVTRGSNNSLAIHVDEARVANRSTSPTPAPGVLTLDSDGGSVDIDHLQVFPTGLGTSDVQAVRNRSRSPYCAVAGARSGGSNASRYQWSLLRYAEVDGRGGRAETSAPALAFTIDDDLPAATMTPDRIVDSLGVLDLEGAPDGVDVVLGGTASDPTSGVAGVEVRFAGGPWTRATGAEAWTHSVDVTDGHYLFSTRAIDAVGHVGPTSTYILDVDGAPPAPTIEPRPAVPAKPTVAASAKRSVAMSGSVADERSGVARMEVQLLPEGESPREEAWQPATVDSDSWSIDYEFASTAKNVSGRYDVRLRATDQLGHRTPPSGPVTTIDLDDRAPVPTLDPEHAARPSIDGPGAISGLVTDGDGSGVASVEVALTPLADVLAQPPGGGTDELTVPLSWMPATLSVAGPGVSEASWSFDVEEGLEDVYQLDVRTKDEAGNEQVTANRWRGVIDTTAPRLTLVAEPTGQAHGDPSRFEVQYRCDAQDRFLDGDTFDCPGEAFEAPIRSFDVPGEIHELFPDLPLLSRMENEYRTWETESSFGVVFTACDLHGNCTAESETVSSVAAPSEPVTVVVSAPTEGQHVPVVDRAEIQVAATATAGLASIEVLVDGAVVDTRTLDGVPAFEALVPVPITGGSHTVVVAVEDAAGTRQESSPVGFFADVGAPTVTLDSTELSADDAWGPGTPVYRFAGTASDDGTLATVELKVGAGPWMPAIVEAGLWRAAHEVPDADGTRLPVQVRAEDLAGRSTLVDTSASVDLGPDDASYERADTVIDTGPASGASGAATFAFSGIEGTEPISAFTCRIDTRAPVPCRSPWTPSQVSVGSHTVAIAAVDVGGLADLSPATWTWDAPPSGPQAVITEAPENPTPQRRAVFHFDGPIGASFQCALDGASLADCTSPVTYDGLAARSHTFEVVAQLFGSQGTPASRTWTVVDLAPVAFDQSVLVASDTTGHEITLQAEDATPLTFRVVDPPDGGFLDGTGATRVYRPFVDTRGADEFRFQAFDGQHWSDVATVAIVVQKVELEGPANAPEGTPVSYEFAVNAPDLDTFELVDQNCGAGGTLSNDTFDSEQGSGGFDCTFGDGVSSAEVSVRLSDSAGGLTSDSLAVIVDNVAPTVELNGPPTADEGTPITLTMASSDPGDDTYALMSQACGDDGTRSNDTFDPGDGSGGFDCVYVDGPSSSVASVQVADSDGAPSNVATHEVQILNVAPTVVLTGPSTAIEGAPVTFEISSTDPGVDTFELASHNCGDGGVTGDATFDEDAGSGVFDCVFDGPASPVVSVQVADSDGALSNLATLTVDVANVAPTVELRGPSTSDEGSPTSFEYEATDPGDDTFEVVAWSCGDGGISTGEYLDEHTGVGGFDCTFDDGPSTPVVSVQVADSDGASSNTAEVTVDVANVAPLVTFVGPTDADEGTPVPFRFSTSDPGTDTFELRAQDCGAGNALTNAFFDAATGAGGFDCTFVEGPSTARPSVLVADDDGGEGTAAAEAAVHNVAPVVVSLTTGTSVNGKAVVGEAVRLRGEFTDLGVLDLHGAQVDWGDGTAEPVAIDEADGAGTMAADHAYAEGGVYELVVTLMDDDGAVVQATTTAVVNIAPVVDAGPDTSTTFGDVVALDISFVDPGPGDDADWTITVDWRDDTEPDVFTMSTPGPTHVEHTYWSLGDRVVEVCVTEGGVGSSESGCDDVVVRMTPLATRTGEIRDALSALDPSADSADRKDLEKALEHLDDALDPEPWIDGDHLDPDNKGKDVFKDLEDAIEDLEKVESVDVSEPIAELVVVARTLALVAIEETRAAIESSTGDDEELEKAADDLAKAEAHLADGDAERAEDEHDKAADDYRKAWEDAAKAREHVDRAEADTE